MKILIQNFDEKSIKQNMIDTALLSSPVSLHKNIQIKPTYKLHEYQGFYALEENEDQYFRWTKHSFYFDLPIDRTRKRKLLLTFYSPNDVNNHITCYVDGKKINTKVEEKGKRLILKGIVLSKNIVTNTRISFLMGSIDEDMNNNNIDMYSIMFEKLKIK